MTVENHLGDRTVLTLARAILIYEKQDAAFATVHDVVSGRKPRLLEGRLLTSDAISALLQSLLKQNGGSGFIPESVLATGWNRLVWWMPSRIERIWFRPHDSKDDALQKLNGKKVRHPALVFSVRDGHVSIFALAENKRPTPKTKLFQAPYYNISKNGALCVGNAGIPHTLHPADIPRYEAAFFESNFTHNNCHGARLTKHPGGHTALWTAMQQLPETFPGSALAPRNITLNSLLLK